MSQACSNADVRLTGSLQKNSKSVEKRCKIERSMTVRLRRSLRMYGGANDGMNSGDGLWSRLYTNENDYEYGSGDKDEDDKKKSDDFLSPPATTVSLSRSDEQFLKDSIEFTYGKVLPEYESHAIAPGDGVVENVIYEDSDEVCHGQWTPSNLSSQASIDLDDLNNLFSKVKFPRRPHDKLVTALTNSHTVITARAARRSRWAKKGQVS